MLTVILILSVLNVLLNSVIGFLTIIAMKQLGAFEKYRFELETVKSSELVSPLMDATVTNTNQ